MSDLQRVTLSEIATGFPKGVEDGELLVIEEDDCGNVARVPVKMIAVPRTEHLGREALASEELVEMVLLEESGEIRGGLGDDVPEEGCLVLVSEVLRPGRSVLSHLSLNEGKVVGVLSHDVSYESLF